MKVNFEVWTNALGPDHQIYIYVGPKTLGPNLALWRNHSWVMTRGVMGFILSHTHAQINTSEKARLLVIYSSHTKFGSVPKSEINDISPTLNKPFCIASCSSCIVYNQYSNSYSYFKFYLWNVLLALFLISNCGTSMAPQKRLPLALPPFQEKHYLHPIRHVNDVILYQRRFCSNS